jgi:rhodanese-related sulfurtransferase
VDGARARREAIRQLAEPRARLETAEDAPTGRGGPQAGGGPVRCCGWAGGHGRACPRLGPARASLPRRPSPAEALAAQANRALLIDIRGDDQRRATGLIPGALLIPRNSPGMALRPRRPMAPPAITSRNQHLILICQEGFQSSLAASSLQRLGLVNATDLDGGFAAWTAAGLPVTRAGRE